MPITVETKTTDELALIQLCPNSSILIIVVKDIYMSNYNNQRLNIAISGNAVEYDTDENGIINCVIRKEAGEEFAIENIQITSVTETDDLIFDNDIPNPFAWNTVETVNLRLLKPFVVIGAGAAGLKAAAVLLEAGRKVILYEASNRIGGRAWTDGALGGVQIDLGCQWFHRNDWIAEYNNNENWTIDEHEFFGDKQRSAYPWIQTLNETYRGVAENLRNIIETNVYDTIHNDGDATTHAAATIMGDYGSFYEANQEGIDQIIQDWRAERTDEENDQIRVICEKAYGIEKAKWGPLEEAAEYEDFCTIDLNDDVIGNEDPGPLVGFEWNNEWSSVGYGGFIQSFGEHLQATYPGFLQIYTETRVNEVVCTNSEHPEILIGENRIESSAVVVTVSSGVITSEFLRLSGDGTDAVVTKYGQLPMGNYKKIVILFDTEVLLVQVPGAADPNEDEEVGFVERGTSVYWHLDENNRVWKFIVPDVNRCLVITIVGGALADALDESDDVAQNRTRAELQSIGLINNDFVVAGSRISHWKTEANYAGAYSYTRPGEESEDARKFLIEHPLDAANVFLAGEALHGEYGTAHGAYVSGWRVANKILSGI